MRGWKPRLKKWGTLPKTTSLATGGTTANVSHLHDSDGVCSVYLSVFGQLLPKGGHAPLQVLPLSGVLRVHVCLGCLVSPGCLLTQPHEEEREIQH